MKNQSIILLISACLIIIIGCTDGEKLISELKADFSSDVKSIIEGETVHFKDESTGSPSSWNWIFQGGTPSTSISQFPSVVYTTQGDYQVRLTISDSETEDTETKTDFITVEKNSIPEAPPFEGTIFVGPDILKPEDPTEFLSLKANGRGERVMFDRRANDWVNYNAYLFNAIYAKNKVIEIQVNPEFDSISAEADALKYSEVIGRLPAILLKNVETVWIHKGINLFGGGNNNLLIHTGQAELYETDGILEEVFIHEASHTSLDSEHADSQGWLDAQKNDPVFISTYAQNNPDREDIAESFLLFLAVRYRSDRISESLNNSILNAIPNRLIYFDNQSFDLFPIE